MIVLCFLCLVTPLPKIQGIQLTSSNRSSMDSLSKAAITPAERKKYQNIYWAQNPTSNGIPANTARNLFAKSRLPNHQLSQIW
jgi:epidermal growth factor receptor substrate 15